MKEYINKIMEKVRANFIKFATDLGHTQDKGEKFADAFFCEVRKLNKIEDQVKMLLRPNHKYLYKYFMDIGINYEHNFIENLSSSESKYTHCHDCDHCHGCKEHKR